MTVTGIQSLHASERRGGLGQIQGAQKMSDPLPAVYSVADVAAALGETERFVKDKCRQRVWPHRRGSRGRISFTAEDYAQVLELCSAPPASAADAPRWSLAPRSRRAS